jgi:uncharacterized protein YbjT (DUF2867 family)
MVRDATRLSGRPWLDQVEVVEADVLKPDALIVAMDGVTDGYYLVHSMADGESLPERDLVAARNFGAAAKNAGVERIIYLGGLGDPDGVVSPHLRSRHRTGDVLRESGVAVTEFRCALIVGSGSISFDIIRYLTELFPVILCPSWAYTRVQPIAIRDVLSYLVDSLQLEESCGRIIEIGGADALSYRDMMGGYAVARGLRRLFVPVPSFGVDLSPYWLHWITPVPAGIVRALTESLRDEMLVRDDLARRLFPGIAPLDYATALRLALLRLDFGHVETTWSDALATSQGDVPPVTLTVQDGIILERRRRLTPASPEAAFRVFTGIGGRRGWLFADWTWTLRGAFDRLIGGVGMRRGRRHPDEIFVGEALDFWRVEAVQENRLLRLRAEMKVPGRAWLEFEARPRDDGQTLLTQTAYFVPKGLAGLAYWYLLYPIHTLIFSGLIAEIDRRAEVPTPR